MSRRASTRSLGVLPRASRRTRYRRRTAILLQLLQLAGGLALLIAGAEALVRGAIRLAKGLGISSFAVGLTVVALGTSFPELFVSVIASLRGDSAVALGNVVGSNIFNIAVILAIGAMIRPIGVEIRLLQLEIPFVLGISILLAVLARNDVIGRPDGILLLALFAGYMLYLWKGAAPGEEPLAGPGPLAPDDPETDAPKRRGAGTAAVLVVVGLAVMVFGGHWLVDAATQLARAWGVSDRVIGLTLLAGGTSLPELASTLVAFRRAESDLAVGNLLGSNIFNTLAIVGTASLVQPIPSSAAFLIPDMLVMLLGVGLLVPLARSRWRIGRWEGLGLFMIYVGYLAFIFFGPGGG